MLYAILNHEVNCKAKIDIPLTFMLTLFGTEGGKHLSTSCLSTFLWEVGEALP